MKSFMSKYVPNNHTEESVHFPVTIAPGRGTNRNEALHRWIGHLLIGSRVGVRLAYALSMIVFDRINRKDRKSLYLLLEETRVLHDRLKLIECDHSTSSQVFERSDEIFGFGLETLDKREITSKLTEPQSNCNNHAATLSHFAAIDLLNKVQSNMATSQSLANLSKAGTEVSHRHFSHLNTTVNLFSNAYFSTDRDVIEHDKRIDDILKNWSMSREHIPKDGDCCFRAVARNFFRITRTGQIEVVEHLANLGLFKLSEDSLVTKLRDFAVSEWSGENRQHYENFLTTDNFENEVSGFPIVVTLPESWEIFWF